MLQTRQNSDHIFWIKRALNLAQSMRGHVWPNPAVGCLVVKDGVVLAEAATNAGGYPHAERKALALAGAGAKGATLYVTLEPCCHWGKTPPCTDAIIDAGIVHVVCPIRDLDPRVNGKGFAALREAGINLRIGECRQEAKELVSGFFNRIRHGVPEVVVVREHPKGIPSGIDALVFSSPDGARLVTRSRELDVPRMGQECLLRWLGDQGLTSVAVPLGDPLVSVLTSPTACKHEKPMTCPPGISHLLPEKSNL